MLAAAAITAFGGAGLLAAASCALALAAALVLDTADGRLARLQGTGSSIGRWLDHVLDEAADLALHTAVGWSMFRATSQPGWIVLGTFYAAGKYVFLVQSHAGEQIERERAAPGHALIRATGRRPSRLRWLIRLAGHADVRWHLWIVLALVGRLDLALMGYAVYFPLRTLGAGVARGVARD
jgi:hypothetical protein